MDESTASESSPTRELTPEPTVFPLSNLPVEVLWTDKGQTEYARLIFNLHRDVRANEAFISLQTKLYQPNKRKTALYLFIYPECIQTLDLDDEGAGSSAREDFSGKNTYSLRFVLHQPATLVVPKDDSLQLEWNDNELLGTIRALARQTSFVVCLPRSTTRKPNILALCEGVTSCGSMQRRFSVTSLYGGRGGKVFMRDHDSAQPRTAGTSTEAPRTGAPPSYSDIGPGPPLPPLLAKEKESATVAASGNTSRKRPRTGSESNATRGDKPNNSMEDMLSEILSCVRRVEGRLENIEGRLEQLEAQVGLKQDEKFEELADRVHTLEQMLEDQPNELGQYIDEKIDRDMEQVESDVHDAVMDRFDVTREEIKTKVKDLVNARGMLELEFDLD